MPLRRVLVLYPSAVAGVHERVGVYIDRIANTTAVGARFMPSEVVDTGAISVETLEGAVMWADSANSQAARVAAEAGAADADERPAPADGLLRGPARLPPEAAGGRTPP